MAVRYFCDGCGFEGSLSSVWVHAEASDIHSQAPHDLLPEFHAELCSACLAGTIAEYREFIDRLCIPRAKRP